MSGFTRSKTKATKALLGDPPQDAVPHDNVADHVVMDLNALHVVGNQ